MFNIEYTEDNPQECSLCGDEACFAKECEKEIEIELCKCGATMAKIYSQGEFKKFCPVCRPTGENKKREKFRLAYCRDCHETGPTDYPTFGNPQIGLCPSCTSDNIEDATAMGDNYYKEND